VSITPAERFSQTAAGYAATMAPSLRPVAAEVVRRAGLTAGDRVLDLGTGTGNAAAMATAEGRTVIGVDAAPGMLEIARGQVSDVEFVEMDFGALAFADASFDVLISVHALLFATDRGAVLREWVRVTRPEGRLSLSVPGPGEVTPSAIYGDVYDRCGIEYRGHYPTPESMAELAIDAGWADVKADADPDTAIVLPDAGAFRVWREIGSRGAATADFTPEQHRALTDEMLPLTPIDADGRLRIPFGTIYLAAVAP